MDKSATQWMVEPLRNYANFQGRARRKEYWWFELLVIVVSFVLSIVDTMIFGATFAGIGMLGGMAALALLVPNLAVGVRRLHDRDQSGWWLLLGAVPLIGGLILLFWFVQRGTVGDNRFGADPLAGEA